MKIYIAGHNGMVGSALVRRFAREPGVALVLRTRRELELMKTKVLAIDFVKDHIAHQIFCEVPAELFAEYRPALLRLIETYQPLSPAAPARKTP